jgi:hypothetical protein
MVKIGQHPIGLALLRDFPRHGRVGRAARLDLQSNDSQVIPSRASGIKGTRIRRHPNTSPPPSEPLLGDGHAAHDMAVADGRPTIRTYHQQSAMGVF